LPYLDDRGLQLAYSAALLLNGDRLLLRRGHTLPLRAVAGLPSGAITAPSGATGRFAAVCQGHTSSSLYHFVVPDQVGAILRPSMMAGRSFTGSGGPDA
jgi:hypothetical protein